MPSLAALGAGPATATNATPINNHPNGVTA
jgi:hypothetical protein